MELKTFIADSLAQIIEGVEEAQQRVGDKAYINPRHKYNDALAKKVEFDVALTVEQTSKGGASGKISVFGNSLGGGGEMSSSANTASRIKFEVEVILPWSNFKSSAESLPSFGPTSII